jgi:hypothetical protein
MNANRWQRAAYSAFAVLVILAGLWIGSFTAPRYAPYSSAAGAPPNPTGGGGGVVESIVANAPLYDVVFLHVDLPLIIK